MTIYGILVGLQSSAARQVRGLVLVALRQIGSNIFCCQQRDLSSEPFDKALLSSSKCFLRQAQEGSYARGRITPN